MELNRMLLKLVFTIVLGASTIFARKDIRFKETELDFRSNVPFDDEETESYSGDPGFVSFKTPDEQYGDQSLPGIENDFFDENGDEFDGGVTPLGIKEKEKEEEEYSDVDESMIWTRLQDYDIFGPASKNEDYYYYYEDEEPTEEEKEYDEDSTTAEPTPTEDDKELDEKDSKVVSENNGDDDTVEELPATEANKVFSNESTTPVEDEETGKEIDFSDEKNDENKLPQNETQLDSSSRVDDMETPDTTFSTTNMNDVHISESKLMTSTILPSTTTSTITTTQLPITTLRLASTSSGSKSESAISTIGTVEDRSDKLDVSTSRAVTHYEFDVEDDFDIESTTIPRMPGTKEPIEVAPRSTTSSIRTETTTTTALIPGKTDEVIDDRIESTTMIKPSGSPESTTLIHMPGDRTYDDFSEAYVSTIKPPTMATTEKAIVTSVEPEKTIITTFSMSTTTIQTDNREQTTKTKQFTEASHDDSEEFTTTVEKNESDDNVLNVTKGSTEIATTPEQLVIPKSTKSAVVLPPIIPDVGSANNKSIPNPSDVDVPVEEPLIPVDATTKRMELAEDSTPHQQRDEEVTHVIAKKPQKAGLSTVLLIICIISLLILLIIIAIIIIIVRARLNKRGKYEITSDVDSNEAAAAAGGEGASGLNRGADKAVVTVQYNDSHA